MPKEKFLLMLQHIVPQHFLSWLLGVVCRCRFRPLKNWMIRTFINRYQVDLSIAALKDINDYPHFNSFFTRHLAHGARPIATDVGSIVSPADSVISQLGRIEKNIMIQAKSFTFNLNSLLGGNEANAQHFYDGSFATFYLAPRDYHRFHMPMTGTLREAIYIPGDLFSVNAYTAAHVTNLFGRNERVVCLFETEAGLMAVVLVGAMLVGSIQTVWEDKPYKASMIQKRNFPTTGPDKVELLQGGELGYFQMGSTILVLFQKDRMAWNSLLKQNVQVQMGQLVGLSLPQ